MTPEVEKALQADDYLHTDFVRPEASAGVALFMAWYADQSQGGVHSPEICLPGGGWEIAWLERSDVAAEIGSDAPFEINKAIIQKGEQKMMVYYWFEQKGRRIAWDFEAKYWLMIDGIRTGRTDGALVRLMTPLLAGEAEHVAEGRLQDVLENLRGPLPRFIPNGEAN
ncbi:exosortase C-terminal domain/associated protein EpsI [Tateyamaria omphalii]|uniref:exosortase C-terminal domain/associated protein EpsI n=1 Tax=Tateyamaria omphalii TaxID=299262 RepID=UPI0020C76FF2|nr:exosortase C-terminal domain/associated protein EpsI [Tateyamaria omphalii]